VRVRELFACALDTAPDARDRWLAAESGDDQSVLEEVRALLAAHADASGLLSSLDLSAATSSNASRSATLSTPPIGLCVGHYRLDGLIGSGGMGQVFRAWDTVLDRPAALKLIRSDLGPSQTVRFLQEVESNAQLQHPAIATFFEGGDDRGTVYLAMELVQGTTLRQRLAPGGIEPAEALTLLTGLLEALAHAHAAGLLHRDIKPENVMVTPAGQAKLLDFGIARQLSLIDTGARTAAETKTTVARAGTATAGAAGTPGYMSPEQLRGEILTPASDVFQTGALLFEMLTGRRAFGEGSPMARLAATLAGPPDLLPLATLQPRGLGALVARALAFEPAERFESAAAFLRQVDALVDGRLRGSLPESLLVANFDPIHVPPVSAMAPRPSPQSEEPNDWVGRALSEVLGSHLRRLRDVRIVSGAPVARVLASASGQHLVDPVRVALMFGARWVVAGRYRRHRDRLSVTVQLFDASTGEETRRAELTGSVDEVLSRPDALALPIVDALAMSRPGPSEGTNVSQTHAIELHLKARQLWQSGSRDAHPRVFALLEEALAASPDFVPALTLLAAACATSFIASRDPGDLAKAVAAADHAIAIDPGCAEAWSWRAYALLRQRRVDEALKSYEQATKIGDDPMSLYLYGTSLASLGRHEEALPHLQRAVILEPRHGIGWLSLGWTLHLLLRDEAARVALCRAQALEGQPGPTFVAGVGGYIAECLRSLGDLDLARLEALRGLEAIERSDHSYRDTIRAFCLTALARVALARGDADGARAACAQALAQMRARTLTLAGGHVFVQAMAALARANRDRAMLAEAMAILGARQGYSFQHFFGCSDDVTLFELAVAADELGLAEEAGRLLTQARAAGSCRPFRLSEEP